MIQGKISKSILLFALPIFLGNLFQQLYNVVDSLVVGNVLGKEALAAVTSTASLIFLLVGFVIGVFVGAGVIIARYYGAKDDFKLGLAVHTTLFLGIIAGLSITALGTIFAPAMLRFIDTPQDVFPQAVTYLRIYFAGGLAIVLYNTCVGIYQAVGDSRHPLYYLMVAALLNVVLDLIFVAALNWGVGGAAFATVISQVVSASLALARLLRIKANYRIRLGQLKPDLRMLKRILRMGIPSGIQNSVVGFANVMVQSSINLFGSMAMAGSGSYSKLEGFAFLPITSFSMALTTFVGQNIGAKQPERARQGARFGVITGVVLAQTIGIIIWLFAPQLIALFNRQPEVIAYGTSRARIICLFYFLLSLSHCLSGILRGAGRTRIPMMVMLIAWCLIRIAYIKLGLTFLFDIRVVFWAYPLTWLLSSLAFLIYYRQSQHLFEGKLS